MFETERAKQKDQICFADVDQSRRISKVSMRVASTFEKDLSKFRLSDSKGKHAVDLVWHNCQEGKWLTRDIPDNWEIIGFYCNTSGQGGQGTRLYRLGFILWSPNFK